jgi:predicted dehydrogenase
MDKKITIGVLGPSDIAFRRFVPGIQSSDKFIYAGVAYASVEEWSNDLHISNGKILEEKKKADRFQSEYGAKVFDSFLSLLSSAEIDAVYIPLPPSLHFMWAKKALEFGKHVLLEKPFTTSAKRTQELILLANEKHLALHENYAFIYHNQINEIEKIIHNGDIGEIRLIRAAFGFPYRGISDFRYDKSLGGGALLDCGGYPIKLANFLLGGNSKLLSAKLSNAKGHNVDIFGSATLINETGLTAQLSFGMDNSYKCELEIWGSTACVYVDRIFTTPVSMKPIIRLSGIINQDIIVDDDDQFRNSAEYFSSCIYNDSTRKANYEAIMIQSNLIDQIMRRG